MGAYAPTTVASWQIAVFVARYSSKPIQLEGIRSLTISQTPCHFERAHLHYNITTTHLSSIN